ncbi:MAG: hypothetical protein UR53_C0001G0074 [Candidatus Magasanikbacteria bacterium GW2011_GWC2_34_16]|uniref:SET domain-containing protein n=2 Tax=Candidatus Magasanikiibacteriota TaxID=1752731 RepID=A0A0G0KKL4_9BACT|nr:MAG: hypothetical protein UR53_C0001G0074 [Candidatus Magasanikbacteria bacterium GW2011_GWC2_34_16]KKQ41116.1 MAG: hypothetical protein US58_C0005G0041 [Candidatus Magasanikbacteria bacterium GW2011_GWA2_37_8]
MSGIIIKKSKINKTGVFADKNFKKGETVLKWKPKQILTKKEISTLPESEKHYVYNSGPNEYVLQNTPERYVNHSCEPNTKVINKSDIAIRDIKKGEEITSDYSTDNATMHFKCNCDNKNCKKDI